jgi:oxygen-independent coproporphyrinogen-3 oxidase
MNRQTVNDINLGCTSDEQVFGAYIHIPFCNYKCHFCDFVTAPNNAGQQHAYCNTLGQEIEQRISRMSEKPSVGTVFYGGGTPGTLESSLLAKVHRTLLANIKLLKDAEITLETTPETVTLEKAKLWRELGINRLSIGIESFDDSELKALGRKHTVAEAVVAIDLAIQAGFQNINCDLMYALPVQDLSGWHRSLYKFLQTAKQFSEIKHLSAYSLELSPHTPLAKMFPLANDDKAAETKFISQHEYLLQILPEAGFEQYEISNFSKKGFQSAHNLNYWRQGNYLAFGVAACRYLSPYRSSNWRSLQRYMQDCLGEESSELIDEPTRMREAVMLGLRMNAGIDLEHFGQMFNFDLLKGNSGLISRLLESELIVCTDQRLRLTNKGQTIANLIIAEFF